MTSVVDATPGLGEQTPPVLNLPVGGSQSLGRDAVALLRQAGMRLDPWQEYALQQSLAERPDGLWSAPDVGLVVARQNGKGEVIIARQLVGLFLLDEALQVYTSHKFATSIEMFRRLRDQLMSFPPFASRVKSVRVANGDVGVELKSGARVRFLARTPESGRGFAGVSTLYLDEAMYLSDLEHDALTPITTAAPNPQSWFVGSAGVGEPSVVFSRVRRRALAGDGQILWLEWAIPDGADPADESLWGVGNPALGSGRITPRTLRSRLATMSPEGFAREYLGRGDWPEDESTAAGEHPVPVAAWAAAADPRSVVEDPVVFGLAVAVDGASSAVGVAGRRGDGLTHVEVVDHRPGTHWVADSVAGMLSRHRGSVVVLDAGSRANQLVPGLVAAGVPVFSGQGDPAAGSLVLLGARDTTAAFGGFVSGVVEERLRYRPHPGLDAAVAVATSRHVGQALAWSAKGMADISPLLAVTLAAYGHSRWSTSTSAFNIW